MKYLCLIYEKEERIQSMPPDEYQALCVSAMDYEEELKKNGKLILAEPLQPVETATVLKFDVNGRASITDGPFVETKEQLGGFFLIEASDLNEAIRIASKIPPGRLGSIEVRPIRPFPRRETP